MTFTIACDDLLYACVPDGDNAALEAELRVVEEDARITIDRDRLKIITGLTLTNEEPEDENRIIWRGHDLGWLTDTDGQPYKYAIR